MLEKYKRLAGKTKQNWSSGIRYCKKKDRFNWRRYKYAFKYPQR